MTALLSFTLLVAVIALLAQLTKRLPAVKYILWWPGYVALFFNYYWPTEWGNKRNTAGSARRWQAREWLAPVYSLLFYGAVLFVFMPAIIRATSDQAREQHTPVTPSQSFPATPPTSVEKVEDKQPDSQGTVAPQSVPAEIGIPPGPPSATSDAGETQPTSMSAPSVNSQTAAPAPVSSVGTEAPALAALLTEHSIFTFADCDRPLDMRARLVCRTPRLVLLNRQATERFNAASSTLNAEQKSAAHKRWLRDYARCQDKIFCIEASYEDLLSKLEP
jgi:hypothetical protein